MTEKRDTFKELSSVLADARVIAVFMAGIIGFFVWLNVHLAILQKDIDTIQNNHLVHIQAAIEDNSEQIEFNRRTNESISQTLSRIEALLEVENVNQ